MNENKRFLTFTEDDGSEVVYEVIDECVIDGESYIAITPAEYYVLKKVQSTKKEDLYMPVEGKELDKALKTFDERINK